MDARRPIDARAAALMTLLCVVWSLQQISLKAAAPDVGPMLMVSLRSAMAAVLVWAALRRQGQPLAIVPGRWRPGLLAGALFALEYLLVAEALRLTQAAHVVVFLYTAPVFAALGLHRRLPAERLGRWQWGGIGLAFAGIALAFLGGAQGQADADGLRMLWGDGLALLAGMAWGATTVTIRCTPLGAAPAGEVLLYQLLVAALLLAPAAALGGQWHFSGSAAAWGHLLFQTVVVSFASFLAWFWLLRHYLASRLGVFSFMTPIFGVLLGAWLLGEALSLPFIAGSALVLAGIVAVSLGGLARPASTRA